MPLFLILLLAAAASAQERPLYRADVTLVRVDVQVSMKNGRQVEGLTARDFAAYDEGAPQRIVHFEHGTEPLDVLLLLDISGSMRKLLPELADVARTALRPLGPADRVALAVFARDWAVKAGFTTDFAAVEKQIRDAVYDRTVGLGTKINAHIVNGAQLLAKEPVRGRRAIVIVTDNQCLNFVPDETVVRELYSAGTVLNAIVTKPVRRFDPWKDGLYTPQEATVADVFTIAEQSGGEAIKASQAAAALPKLIERIRSRYAMAYQPPAAAPGQYRRIRVELAPDARRRHPGAVVRARAGYFTE